MWKLKHIYDDMYVESVEALTTDQTIQMLDR